MRISDWSSDVCSSDLSENYPQLKADGLFRDLQAQLEGTENRITVARNRYIQAVQQYNTTVRSFPSNLTAKFTGAQIKPSRSEERRVGKECVSKCRSRWSP